MSRKKDFALIYRPRAASPRAPWCWCATPRGRPALHPANPCVALSPSVAAVSVCIYIVRTGFGTDAIVRESGCNGAAGAENRVGGPWGRACTVHMERAQRRQ
jgi:hypothetical protein